MVEDAIQRERQELGKGELALAELSRAASIRHANLFKTERGDSAAKIGVRITVRADDVDDTAADQAKVPSVHWELIFAEKIDETIKKAARKGNHAALRSLHADAIHDVRTGLPFVQEVQR